MNQARVESPLFAINKPTYEQDLGYKIPLKKRSIENQNALDLLKPSKGDQSTDLFPEIQRMLPLTEEEVAVNFDQPAFAAPRAKKENKPDLPKPTVAAKSTQTEPLIGYNYRVNNQVSSQRDKDELAHLPKQGGAILAKLIGMITDYQATTQSLQLEVFSATSSNLEEIHKKELELLIEQIRNRKDMETWSYRLEFLSYLGAATGIVAGSAMIGTSFTNGGVSAIPGIQMLAGSAISLVGNISSRYFDEHKITPLIDLAGNLLSGYGIAKGVKDFDSALKAFGFANASIGGIAQYAVQRKVNQNNASRFEMNAKNINLQYQREDNETTMRKLIGGFTSSKESSDLLGAATKALRTENEVKSRIALGSRA